MRRSEVFVKYSEGQNIPTCHISLQEVGVISRWYKVPWKLVRWHMENLSSVCRSAHMVGRLSAALGEVANKQQDDISDTAPISYKRRLVEPGFRCSL